ncbi:diacylglycerol kinase protein DgkA [Tieghemostelium lacteum]|uniref:Ras modification protein ERF4 n=1 Tax=Tieghemostelium lacteum TaxID=361077 RepID=A0A152A3H6_TIELA|nr:diacylglycerol kinase protein DgkA [Tieghemostelium lacteum]|eukprot:KYR00601.1 diacylglycerol kinase protein DgkA [Tieghemostelium lacteum]
MSSNQTNNTNNSNKNVNYQTVNIQRDYRDIITKFEKDFPQELQGKVTQNEFEYTIDKINGWLEVAETVDARSIFQECVGCLTFYSFYLCFNDKYKTCVNKIKEFIKEQNENVYNPKGVTWLNPINNGFLKIEILVHQKESINSTFSSSSSSSSSPSTLIPTNNATTSPSNTAIGSTTISSTSSNTSNIELTPMSHNNTGQHERQKSRPHHKIDIVDDRVIQKPETILNVNTNNNNIVDLSSDEDEELDSSYETSYS